MKHTIQYTQNTNKMQSVIPFTRLEICFAVMHLVSTSLLILNLTCIKGCLCLVLMRELYNDCDSPKSW